MLLKIEHLSFGWDETLLLEDLTDQLMPGEIVQLMGPNGAGKTTLLHLIAGMIPHFQRGALLRGDILIQGRSIMSTPPKAFFPQIAYIPSLHLDFLLLTESLRHELQLTSAIIKADLDLLEQRVEQFSTSFPEIRSIREVPFKSMPYYQKILSATLIFYLQQASVYLFDEIFPAFSEQLKFKYLDFFRWLSSTRCAVIFVDHQRSTNGFTKWILREKHLERL